VGRVFLMISFPVDMNTYPEPSVMTTQLTDAVSGPTPLSLVKEGVGQGESVQTLMQQLPEYSDMMIGNIGGSLGEISAVAILLGGIFMLIRGYISWHIPVSYLGSVFAISGILWLINPELYADPVFHLVTGGLMLGALYMATDMVTSPMTGIGMIVFGIGCGFLTILIRLFGAYPEGVAFAILIMNGFVPLINKGFRPRRFGKEVKIG
jgi:Na+-translocating ferredoxin:NAD+ oxidoreductase subunit D